MTRIAGASQFLNTSALANARGIAPSTPTLLSAASPTSLLDAGRGGLLSSGTGLSSSARSINNQFLNQSQDLGNQILSLGVGASATIEGLQQNILAIRAGIPDSQLSPSLRGNEVDTEA